jgi:hypothetical protein
LRKDKPTLFVELDDNNLRDQGQSAAALVKFLREVGYKEIKNAENEEGIDADFDFKNCHFDIVAR